jgi:hypothetical protein
MGVQSPHCVLWKTVRLPVDLALQVIQNIKAIEFARLTAASDTTGSLETPLPPLRQRLKLLIDANLVGYKHLCSKSTFSSDQAVMHIAKTLSERHCDVVIGADHPTNRHPSKRATCKRRADAQKDSIKLTVARTNLQTLLSVQEVESPAKQADEIQEAQSRIRSLEGKLKRRLPDDFAVKLGKSVEEYSPEGKGDISFFVAPTQADPCLAKMIVDGVADAVISDDSDFPMYIGPSGMDIMMKDVMISSKGDPITSVRLCTGQARVANLIEAMLAPKLSFSPFEKDDKNAPKRANGKRDGNIPSYPIFSGVEDPMVRALSAVVVGCDACPGGVSNQGAAATDRLLKKHDDKSGTHLHRSLAREISGMKGSPLSTEEAVMCVAESLLYEKTNDGGYVHGNRPRELCKYLEAFKHEDTNIIEGPLIQTCKGCTGPHPFLDAEGVRVCAVCNETLCRFCFLNEKNVIPDGDDRVLCLECMRDRVLGGRQEDEQDMRAFLRKKSVPVPVSASYLEVLSLYDDAVSGAFDHFENDIKKVKYPILPTSALHVSQPEFDRIHTVKVERLQDLIMDEKVPLDDAIGLIRVLAAYTRVPARRKGEKLSYKHVLPSNIVDIASHCRVHTGERLCWRGLQHALDAGTPDILVGDVTLAKYDGRTCIIINNEILASMKSILYRGESAFNETELLATSCPCRAGCKNESLDRLGASRVACTHAVARLVEGSQLLFRQEGAMSHHLLINLRSRLRKEGAVDTLRAEVTRQLKDDIISLIKATGQRPPMLASSTSLLELLDEFAASTDKPRPSPGEPKTRDLGLLREKAIYISPALQADRMIPKLEQGGGDSSTAGDDADEDTQDPEMGDDPSGVEAMGVEATPEQDTPSFDDYGIKNTPLGTATHKEFSRGKLAMSGVSLCFGYDKLETLMKTLMPSKHVERMDTATVPIGMQLVQERAEDAGEQDIDYNVHHQRVVQVADEMDDLLQNHCQCRGWKRARTNDDDNEAEESSRMRKRARMNDDKEVAESNGTKKQAHTNGDKEAEQAEQLAESSGTKKRARTNDDKENQPQATKKPKPRHPCCFPGCTNNKANYDKPIKRIPPYPPTLKPNASRERRKTFRRKQFIRREWTDRLRRQRVAADKESDLRMCQEHEMEWVPAQSFDVDGMSVRVEPFQAPKPIGENSFFTPPKTQSKGLGTDRELLRHVMNVSLQEQKLTKETQVALAREGMELHTVTEPTDDVTEDSASKWQPAITLESLTPKEVHRRTGFQDIKTMLMYSVVVYGGVLSEMAKTASYLTWLEELVLLYEFTYGRTRCRWRDWEKDYRADKKTLKKAIEYRLRKELECRRRWPMYASYAEDAKLRSTKWNDHFDPKTGPRVVMHDTTNIHFIST